MDIEYRHISQQYLLNWDYRNPYMNLNNTNNNMNNNNNNNNNSCNYINYDQFNYNHNFNQINNDNNNNSNNRIINNKDNTNENINTTTKTTSVPLDKSNDITNRYSQQSLTSLKLLNGREARNRAEKNRRDKLNGSIQELSGMVPHVAESQRRVDKTAVLRFSAHGLRINYVFGKTGNPTHVKIKPKCTETFLKLMDCFLLTITCRGQIVLVSPSIEHHLGHCQTDLFGQNIFNLIHPDDHALVKKQIVPTNLDKLFNINSENGEESRPRTQEEEERIDRILREDKRNFTIRMARAGPRSEPTTYEIVRITGCFRRADSAPRGVKPNTLPSGLQLIRRPRGRDDGIPLHTISGNDIILVGMASVIKPPNICDRLLEACKYEYKTRHLIDGRIVQCDQRISVVAGYMTEEVSGISPFTFMHKDDVRWVIVALRQMYDFNKSYGESCYRLMTRSGQFIYLRTRGFLEIDNDSNKVHSFICINTLVAEEEGKRLVREMKRKFSVIINQNEMMLPSTNESDVATVENPQQIEKAVLNLITNLSNDNTYTSDDIDDHHGRKRQLSVTGNMFDVSENSCSDFNDDNISTKSSIHEDRFSDILNSPKSPPLAIIAPQASTIKTSISKSLKIIDEATKYNKEMPSTKIICKNNNNNNNSNSNNNNNKNSKISDSVNNNSNNSSNNNLRRPSVLQNTKINNTGVVAQKLSPQTMGSYECNLEQNRKCNSNMSSSSCSSTSSSCISSGSNTNIDRQLIQTTQSVTNRKNLDLVNMKCDYNSLEINTNPMILPQNIKQEFYGNAQMSSPTSEYNSNLNIPSPYSPASYYDPSGNLLQSPTSQQQQNQVVYDNIQQQNFLNNSSKFNSDNNYHRRHIFSTISGSTSGIKRGNYDDDYDIKESLNKRRFIVNDNNALNFDKELQNLSSLQYGGVNEVDDSVNDMQNCYDICTGQQSQNQQMNFGESLEQEQLQQNLLQSHNTSNSTMHTISPDRLLSDQTTVYSMPYNSNLINDNDMPKSQR